MTQSETGETFCRAEGRSVAALEVGQSLHEIGRRTTRSGRAVIQSGSNRPGALPSGTSCGSRIRLAT